MASTYDTHMFVHLIIIKLLMTQSNGQRFVPYADEKIQKYQMFRIHIADFIIIIIIITVDGIIPNIR